MADLVIMRGIPGSGKTTWARKWVAEDITRRARVNRDDLRLMVHDGHYRKGSKTNAGTESMILKARDAMIATLLLSDISVVVDDTNLKEHHMENLVPFVAMADSFSVWDLRMVPLAICRERNNTREDPVPDYIMDQMWRTMIDELRHEQRHFIPPKLTS